MEANVPFLNAEQGGSWWARLKEEALLPEGQEETHVKAPPETREVKAFIALHLSCP